MNALPRVTVKPEKGGWSVACAACGWERFEHARPLLDKAAREHQGKCRGPRPDTKKQQPAKARSRADWNKREESTWIDRL